MLPPTLASIPEVKEEYPGSCLIERTARLPQFVELGPPDLCNIHKYSANAKRENEIGTFLYFTGVDTSNTASIAAHLQNIANLMSSKLQYWFGEKKHWKVPELTYCSFNAFSKVDMRVTVHIPGKFEVQVLNHEGKLIHDKLDAEELEKIWTETFVTSIVRSVLESEDGDDVNKVGGLVEVRKVNPFNNGSASKELLNNFLSGFELLFFEGGKLGCNVEIPQPTTINNYLVDGFIKVVQLTQSYDRGIEILQRLHKVETGVISLIAKLQLLKQDEIGAVKTMHQGIQENKRDSDLLVLQAEFCLDKKKPELALELANQAVKSSPSDFKTWAILVKVYTKLGDYENALLTLNSCPMNSHKEKYHLKRVVPIRSNDDLHLPSPMDVTLEEVSNLQSNEIGYEQKNLDPSLANLPAANLKSTFAKAYDLLTEIVVKTGWEALLKYRAKVFVMEEEYRKDRQSSSNGFHSRKNSTTSTATVNGTESTTANDAASTMAIKSPGKGSSTADVASASYDDEFRKKRLCERWLDNLFMLLYEDLRAYTMWQAESLHFQAQQMEYKKTTLEWEILGSVAFRLKHFKEGSTAFANALSGRFSAKSQLELLKYYIMERSKLLTKNSTNQSSAFIHGYTKMMNQLNEKILESIIKLLVWNHRWYCDFSLFLLVTLGELEEWEGERLQSLVNAHHVGNTGVIDMMNDVTKTKLDVE
ncbi:Protein BCH1 [Candida viswanathii]|uniref:Protein BCH1 n=1 Tax=Candida viswanathii TaxID=5486 RepID=A0A367YD03_9ASCO|nr:Protein BCH1 [Candida viswanathii]